MSNDKEISVVAIFAACDEIIVNVCNAESELLPPIFLCPTIIVEPSFTSGEKKTLNEERILHSDI